MLLINKMLTALTPEPDTYLNDKSAFIVAST